MGATKICPRCNQVYIIVEHTGDYIHKCSSGNATLDNEDVPVISATIEDENGQTISTGRKVGCILWQGVQNKLWGSKAAIRGEDVETMSSRGARVSTHRVRKHQEYIKD